MRAALVILLLLPLALAQSAPEEGWTNGGGDAARSGVARGIREPLDVVAIGTLDPALALDQYQSVGLLPTGEVLVGVATTGGSMTCALLVVEDAAALAARTQAFECANEADLLALDRPAGLVFVCTPGSGGKLVRAFDLATLEERWSHSIDGGAATPLDEQMAGEVTEWDCGGAILRGEPRQLIVPLARNAAYDGEVVALDPATGALSWRARTSAGSILAAEAWRAAGPTPLLNELRRADAGNGFLPNDVTATTSGFVVVGLIETRAAYVTLDVNGTPVGGGLAHTEDARHALAAAAPTAQGPLAAFPLGRELIVVDPAGGEERGLAPAPLPASDRSLPTPAWWNDLLLLPGDRSVAALATPGFTPAWNWTADPGASIEQVLVAPPSSVYVLLSRPLVQEREVALARLDARSGEELQRLVLTPPAGAGAARMLPWPAHDALVVLFDDTTIALLAEADPALAPEVTAASRYPALDSPATLNARAPGATSLRVAWGDGAVEDVAASEASLTHQYAAARDRTARVTATYPDGRTATTELVLHVGAMPPMQLTAIQRALAPENQEITFFLLGLALTGGGAVFAAALRRRRHSRLAQEEAKLRAVIDDSLLNPTHGLAALEAHRAHLRDAHTRRRLDDAQFGLLDQRTVRAMKSARYRLLGGVLNKVSPHFRRVLDTALEDGQVTSGEMAALVQSLESEAALSPEERERVGRLLSSWAR